MLPRSYQHGDGRKACQGEDDNHPHLTLFVSGRGPNSIRAIQNITRFCEQHLDGHHRLEVVDLYQQPERASGAHILVTPTLVRDLPQPIRRLVGDLGDTESVLRILGLERMRE
jgi:circadian clock protein KaiB